MDWEVGASGYAAVWATENTREAIWDAMQRKETYATTGPRMIVRFFGGWDFEADDAQTACPRSSATPRACPMGGDLRKAPAGKSPTFLVAALKDPIGANLDRIQVVKGWLDAKGELHEKVYDVAWGGDRKPGADGKLPSVGSTVDVANATWTNTIGAPELITVWKDPAFDAAERAFYYARVHRDSHAALDRLRREALRHEAAAGHPDDRRRARLHLADLVHAVELNCEEPMLSKHALAGCCACRCFQPGLCRRGKLPDQPRRSGAAEASWRRIFMCVPV